MLTNLLLDDSSRRFKKHNEYVWKNYASIESESIILLDSFFVPEWIISSSYFANILAKKFDAKILNFSRLINPDLNKFRKSYNVCGNISLKLNKLQKDERNDLLIYFRGKVKTKQDLYNFKVKDIWIGIDIYETYLRLGNATINFKDKLFWDCAEEGISYYIFWRDFFKQRKIECVIISHDCYNSMNIIAKISYENNVPVYLPNCRGLNKSTESFSIYSNKHKNFPVKFKKLSVFNQNKAKKWSKKRLEKRFSGEVAVDMRYSTASAFTNLKNQKFLRDSSNVKVLITSHCFFDNPHSYGGLLFPDFYEWLKFLCNISKSTNYDWYIKPHPDYLPGTLDVISKIIENSKIIMISPSASFHQLAKEGLKWALTAFGSVAHELPLLGIEVINCGSNPHTAYDFAWNPKSIKEYKNLILNLSSLKKKDNIEQIYEFYYMFKWASFIDDLIFPSYNKMLNDLSYDEQMSSKIYDYFLDNLTQEKHKEIINLMNNFIESNKINYFRTTIPEA